MSEAASENQSIADALSTFQRTSISAISGLIFAIPAFAILFVIAPPAVGYLLIAATAAIAHTALKALNPDNIVEFDDEISNLNGTEAIVFVTLMVLAVAAGISTKLLASVGIAIAVASLGNEATYAILFAILVPILDREMADIKWYLSVGGLASVAMLLIVGTLLTAVFTMNDVSKDTLKEASVRLTI